ncbi:MAG TPA: hypothetical protein VN253_05695 [Kofleriaceae bacterium]|nr:hypothetical protein [Kofleriaceae bacterium]
MAFERILELGRWMMEQPWARPVRNILDGLTAGRGAVIPAVIFTCVTNANLIDAFKVETGANVGAAANIGAVANQARFFDQFLHGYPGGSEIVGCVLMGLALTLGSRFWHDLVKGMTDVRNKIKAVKPLDQATLLEPPVRQPNAPRVVAAA